MTIQTFTAGQTLTAAQMNTLQNSDFNFTRNVQSGTSYTLALGDKGKLLEFENTGTITLTIPANSSVGFEIGDRVDVLLTSTGSVNISPASGVTLNAEGGLTAISSQWTRVTLIKRGLDAWVLTGGTGEVQTGEIKDSAVTNAKLAANSVTSDKIANGTIVNDDVSATAGILDTKLATISTADKVSLSALNIDGATDIGAAIVDADLIVVDDGGNGTNRKAAATRISDYVFGKVSGDVLIASNGAATIQANSVALGTDTTGNYVASLVAGTGITITNNSGEGATPTIAVTGSTYQPLDAELTALAGTTSAADALPYFTGAGTATTTTLTSAARSILDDASTTAIRTTLGVGTTDSPAFAGATIDAVQVGITAVNEIDTTTGNLIIDSAGGTVTIDDNLIVSGDLTVNGTTTTVNTATLNVSDNIVVLNNDVTGTPSENAGIEVERGTSTNVLVRWNETNDVWEYTNDGTNYFPIVGTTASQALTNKTVALGSNTVSGTKAEFDAAVTDDNFAYLGTAQTFTANQAVTGTITTRAAATQDAVVLQGRAGGTNSRSVTLTPASLSASRTLTLPDKTGTVLTDADLGANVSTFLATPSSANLASAVTDETGTGSVVFGTSPTISTPALTLSTTSSTTEGRIAWDSTNDKILVGGTLNGTAQSIEFAPATLNIPTAPVFSTNVYVAALADKDKWLELNNGSTAGTFQIPTDASVAFPVGTQLHVLQVGTGQITIAAVTPGTTTVNGTPGLKLRAQWSSATIIKRAANTWVVVGDLSA